MRRPRRYTLALYVLLAATSVVVFWPLSDDSSQFRQGIAAAERGAFEETVSLWRPLAEKGYPRAQYGMGVLYERGQGVPRDPALAVDWYGKAARQNIWEAQVNLGLLYVAGDGIARDYASAATWFREAAEGGAADGQINLGNLYRQGWGVERNRDEAMRWFRRAARQGHPLGQYLLAEQLIEMSPPELAQAYFWVTLATRSGRGPIDQAAALRGDIAQYLIEQERAEIEQLAAEWESDRR